MKQIISFWTIMSILSFPINITFAGFVSKSASCSGSGSYESNYSQLFQNTYIDYTLYASRTSWGEGAAVIRTNEPWYDIAIANPDNGKFSDSEVGYVYISATRQVVIEAWADCTNGGSAYAEATYSW